MDSRTKLAKKTSRGFSLVEMIVVLAIIGLLLNISVSVYNSFKAHENLEIATTSVVEAVRHAQGNAQIGKNDSSWGVEILSGSVVIFKGISYAARDVASEQSLNFSGGVISSGLNEIVFSNIGTTTNTGTIIITNSYGSKNISINAKGTLTY